MSHRHVHPSVFMFLIVPFGAISGYVSVAVAYLLAHHGISVEQIAGLVALSVLPHTWKFAWAPIADTTLSRKTWYLIGSISTALGIFATGMLPATGASLPLFGAIVLVSNLGCTFLGMSVESLMAYDTIESEKGRAGGWFQAGNLGGGGIGGGIGLLLAQRLPAAWMAGAIVGGLCLLCALALLFLEEPYAAHRQGRLIKDLAYAAKDLWSVARARLGFLALVLCFLPLGSGAANGLWSAVAGDWHASANTVALVTGIASGLISAAGCLAGGWICDRMDRKAAYAVFGILQAACALFMALAPRSEPMFVVFTSLYSFITGLTYAGFSAFVLEAMGMGAAATKYSVFASLSNTPIWYMTNVDGWAHTRWGSGGMLKVEAAAGMVGLLLFIGVLVAMPRRKALVNAEAVAAEEPPPR
jgi:MFS transporter, PAT family, beta-lactamase induction signal transducer AmpG